MNNTTNNKSIFSIAIITTKVFTAGLIALSLIACSPSTYVTSADRNEVITVGDSIFDKTGELQVFLEQEAGETFRRYTQGGSYLVSGGSSTPIVLQYADAKADNAGIETVVMNGGGNDIMVPALLLDPNKCKTKWWRPSLTSKCKAFIDDLYVDTVNLLNTMDADGVNNIIYLGYYHPKGSMTGLIQAVDYGDLRLEQACSASTANCVFVDSRSSIISSDIISDGLHPNTSGSQKLANLIWPELQPLL